jgi:hypothetical protein
MLENYSTSVKKIEEVTSKWKDIPYSQTGSSYIIKMSIEPKAIYTFLNLYQKSDEIFHKYRKIYPK